MLQVFSDLTIIGLAVLATLLASRTVAGSWNRIVLALAGPDLPAVRRVHSAMRLRPVPRARQAVVISRERAWAAVS